MHVIQTAIIPTTMSKLSWLRVTLRGLALQENVKIEKIRLVVDLKPWDSKTPDEDIRAIIPDIFDIDVDFMKPPMKPKRSHQAVNNAISTINEIENQCVMVMDDDYWLRRTDVLEKLMDQSKPGVFVTPASFDEVDVNNRDYCLDEPISKNMKIYYFDREVQSTKVFCDLSKRGQHPMCGHPKVFFTDDFMKEKGFDVPHFQHYWWCDTDMYYRLKKHFEFIQVPVETWHMNHPRYHPQMFQKPNARRFLEKHQAVGEIAEPHLDALNNQLME